MSVDFGNFNDANAPHSNMQYLDFFFLQRDKQWWAKIMSVGRNLSVKKNINK